MSRPQSGDEEDDGESTRVSEIPPFTDEEDEELSGLEELDGEDSHSFSRPHTSDGGDDESVADSTATTATAGAPLVSAKSIIKKPDVSGSNKGSMEKKVGIQEEEEDGEGAPHPEEQPAQQSGDENDFGQAELLAAKQAEEAIRKQEAAWGTDLDEDEDESKRKDAVHKSKSKEDAATEDAGSKRKRKRRRKSGAGQETDSKQKREEAVEEEFVEPTYALKDYVSGPIISPNCTLFPHILHTYQSYGYDCVRPYNLHMLDDNTLVYITGNYLHFYRIFDGVIVNIRRSASGYGIGHVSVHPSKKYFAVAEKGDWPMIVIYCWPQLKVYRVLRKGTERGYAYVDFSPNGDLLCSLGMEPDYLLTIWNWEKERIILHVKAFSQDIYRATFSLTHPGQLTTCGLGHIRFWKMAETFTGLKLQGLIGRFGKTEISDIQGYAGLPDAKVVSGSEWGNLLVWDGGLIVVEVTQKSGKNCHEGEVTNIILLETGELLTIGLDGYLRTWESEVIDLADTIVGDSGKYEVEPIFEFKISSTAQPMCVIKNLGGDESSWYIQDAWGKIWSVNIGGAMKDPEYEPTSLFSCPGGAINAISTSTTHTMMAVGTSTGHLWLINYLTKQPLAKLKYSRAVTRLLWVPPKYDSKGVTFLAAFEDGQVRLFGVQRATQSEPGTEERGWTGHREEEKTPFQLTLLQNLRFHKARINVLLLDSNSGTLYTCGDDRLIFASKLRADEEGYPYLKPQSFVTAPFPVISLDLHPVKDYRLVIASRVGRVAECRTPLWGDLPSDISYNQGKLHGRRWFYTSVKSARLKEERKISRKLELEQKLEELRLDVAERRAKGVFVEEEMEINRLMDHYKREQSVDDGEELYIPEKPCPVYSVYYRINKSLAESNLSRNFFLHVGGYDAGYIYECKCSRTQAGGFHPVPPTPPFTTDVAIRCFTCSPDNDYLIFGMEDGSIRVMPRYTPPTGKERSEKNKATARALVAESKEDDGDQDNSDDNLNVIDESLVTKKKKKKTLPPFPVTQFPYDLSNFVCLPMHDPDRGPVNDLCWSFDGRILLSVADDGSIFSYRWDPKDTFSAAELEATESKLPSEEFQIPADRIVDDTQDPNALTLEELKVKAEKDRLWELAEGKKEVLRKKIRDLKSKFRYLLQKNNEIPDEARIPRSDFEMDPAIRQQKKQRLMAGIEEVYRRHEWHSAKSILKIEKLEKYFFSEIETFHIVIKDICHTTQVHTFRHRVLTPDFERVLKSNQVNLVKEDIQHHAEKNLAPIDYSVKPVHVTRVHAKELIGDFDTKKYDTKTMHQIRTLEDRLHKRYDRELRWAELNAQQIPDDYEDPTDIVAIAAAKEHLGDYKLKSSDDYTGERVSTTSRRQRVLDLKLRIYETVKTFNEYVLDLREEKRQILKECRELETELKKIQQNLPADLQKPIPTIHDMEEVEEPEKQFLITKEMIQVRTAKKIEELGLQERWNKQQAIEKEELELTKLEFGQGGGGGEREAAAIAKLRGQRRKSKKVEAGPKLYIPKNDKKEAVSTIKCRKAFFKPKTSLANVRLELSLQFRCFQQDLVLRKLHARINYFHDRVERIRDERVSLQVDVILMSMKLINLIQELDIVKDFDSTERAVLERFNAQKVETAEAKDRMDRAQRRLGRVKADLVKMEQAITDVQKEVSTIIGEKQKYSDYLWKVYKKKIRVETAGDEGDGTSEMQMEKHVSSSSSTGDSTDSTSQDSGSDLFKLPKQKLNPNICPEHLDRNLYEKVCEFRAKRTQLEIEAEAQKKVVEKVERDFKEVERIHDKYTGRLEGIGEEVLILQRKKQRKMNELPALVVLKADQIQCLDDEEFDEFNGGIVQRLKHHFPPLNEVVLFPKDGIGKLDLRIEELKEETNAEREKHKRARHMMVRLREELTKLEDEVKQINARCKREMVSKFGKIVDLDDICAAIINLEILDELMRLETRRNWHYRERKKIADEIEKARDRLTFLTKENSENNTLLAILIERQRDVEYFLYKQSKKEKERLALTGESEEESAFTLFENKFDDDLISNEDALEELFNLEDILIRQESRVLILREAIAACKFKSGLPPLIPLRSVKDDVATSFMTMNELYGLRERRNLNVETLFVGKDKDIIGESHSNFPSFASPVDSAAAWGEPQLHTPFDANNTQIEAPAVTMTLDARSEVLEEEDEEEEDDDEEEEETEEELFDVTYVPQNDDVPTGVTAEGEIEPPPPPPRTPSYPLNVIPDDQMHEEEAGDGEEEEEYEGDPLPVAVPSAEPESNGE